MAYCRGRLDGKKLQGLRYDYDAATDKYIIRTKNGENNGRARVFQERHYYFPFGINKLAAVPALVENPGY